jgi:NAD/NADP transhydrogenase alpha subunit
VRARVSLLPEAVATLIGKGHTVFVESNAGVLAFASDDEYAKSGATIADTQTVIQSSEILLSIHPEPVLQTRSKTLIGALFSFGQYRINSVLLIKWKYGVFTGYAPENHTCAKYGTS